VEVSNQLKASTMNRRDFIKTIPLMTVAPLLLTEVTESPKTNKRHLITLGSAAALIVSRYGAELSVDSVTLINDRIPEGNESVVDLIPFFPAESVFEYLGDQRFLKREKLPQLELPEKIKNHLASKSGELVFLAGLGKASGTMLFRAIAQQYMNSLQQLRFVATLPFAFEGSHVVANANQAVEHLSDQSLEASFFPLESIRKTYGNLGIRSAFEKGDEWVVGALNRK
jgi:hypothetical protein